MNFDSYSLSENDYDVLLLKAVEHKQLIKVVFDDICRELINYFNVKEIKGTRLFPINLGPIIDTPDFSVVTCFETLHITGLSENIKHDISLTFQQNPNPGSTNLKASVVLTLNSTCTDCSVQRSQKTDLIQTNYSFDRLLIDFYSLTLTDSFKDAFATHCKNLEAILAN